MHRVCNLWLHPKFGVRPATKIVFCLRSMLEEMGPSTDFTDKYLRLYAYSGTNLKPAINCTNPKTEIRKEIVEIQT